jgi:hypothetical protein
LEIPQCGAMKIARGMFEIYVISEYLEKNPSEVPDYLQFGSVEALRHMQTVENYFSGRVPPELMKQAEAEYDKMKQKFTNASQYTSVEHPLRLSSGFQVHDHCQFQRFFSCP